MQIRIKLVTSNNPPPREADLRRAIRMSDWLGKEREMLYGLPNIVGYRMDRRGTLFVRDANGAERCATPREIAYLLTHRPDLILQLAQHA